MRWAALALAALAACSSEGPTDLARIGGLAVEAVSPSPQAPAPRPDRASLEATGAAVIAVSANGGDPAYVAALADNDGALTYQDAGGRALVLRGGAVVRTFGYGNDLTGLRTGRSDPVSRPRPLADWPGGVDREYRYRVRNGADYSIVLSCAYTRGPRSRIEILQRLHTVVEIEERCTNRRRVVVSRYWVEPESGRIWRSEQWLGPDLPVLTVETVLPYRAAQRW